MRHFAKLSVLDLIRSASHTHFFFVFCSTQHSNQSDPSCSACEQLRGFHVLLVYVPSAKFVMNLPTHQILAPAASHKVFLEAWLVVVWFSWVVTPTIITQVKIGSRYRLVTTCPRHGNAENLQEPKISSTLSKRPRMRSRAMARNSRSHLQNQMRH